MPHGAPDPEAHCNGPKTKKPAGIANWLTRNGDKGFRIAGSIHDSDSEKIQSVWERHLLITVVFNYYDKRFGAQNKHASSKTMVNYTVSALLAVPTSL